MSMDFSGWQWADEGVKRVGGNRHTAEVVQSSDGWRYRVNTVGGSVVEEGREESQPLALHTVEAIVSNNGGW